MTPPNDVRTEAGDAPALGDRVGPGRSGSVGQRTAAGARWGLFNQAVQQSTKFVVTVILARLVAPDDFGLMATAMIVVNLGQLLNGLGFGPALVHRKDLTPQHVRSALGGSSVLGVLFTAGALLGAGPVADFFGEPDLRPVLQVLSIVFLAKSVESVPNDMLRRHLYFKEYVLSSTWAAVASAVAAVVAAAFGLDVWALVIYALVDAYVAVSLGWFFAIRAGVWRPAFGLDRRALGDLAGYSAYMAAARVLTYVQTNGDNFAVSKLIGQQALGFYNLAYRIFLFPIQKVSMILGQVAFPAFAAVQDDPARLRRGFLRGITYTTGVTVPMSLGLCVSAPYLVPVVFGPRWSPAVGALQILTLTGPRAAIVQLNSNLWQGVGKPQWNLWTSLATAPAYVVGIAVGVDHGIAGVAAGVAVASWVTFPLTLHLAAKAISSSSWTILRTASPMLVSSAVMAGVAFLTGRLLEDHFADLQTLVTVAAVGALTYLVMLRLLAPAFLPDLIGNLKRGGRR